MIDPSDIIVTVTKDEKAYKSDTIVAAVLTVGEVATVYHQWAEEEGVINRTKEMVRHAVYQRVYGDLRDSIEEMYVLAMMKMPYGAEMDKVKETKKQIDRIMRGMDQ